MYKQWVIVNDTRAQTRRVRVDTGTCPLSGDLLLGSVLVVSSISLCVLVLGVVVVFECVILGLGE